MQDVFGVSGIKVKVGSFTRDSSLATGTQAVTGLGFSPKALIIVAGQTSSSEVSWGFNDAITGRTISDYNLITAGIYNTDQARLIGCFESGANYYLGTLSSFDADGFTISWTKAGLPTGTLTMNYLAIR